MAENPLLPNAELRALHKLLKTISAPDRDGATGRSSSKPRYGGLEALLAATLLQLRPQDVLLPPAGFPDVQALLPSPTAKKIPQASAVLRELRDSSPYLALAAGLASGMRRASSDGLVLAFATSGMSQRGWANMLAWAQQDLLPVVLVCADPSGPDALRSSAAAEPDVLAWGPFQRAANRMKLPILTVDGEDAVAVYRVMQESALRARSAGGPAVLWAVLPQAGTSRRAGKNTPTPLTRLEHYLQTRKISFR